jgi:hypothetical protein
MSGTFWVLDLDARARQRRRKNAGRFNGRVIPIMKDPKRVFVTGGGELTVAGRIQPSLRNDSELMKADVSSVVA